MHWNPLPTLSSEQLIKFNLLLCGILFFTASYLASLQPYAKGISLNAEFRYQHDDSGALITRFFSANSEVLVNDEFAVEDPDMLKSWEQFSAFMDYQSRLVGLIKNNQVFAETVTGEQLTIPIETRHLFDLPWKFYVLNVYALITLFLAISAFGYASKTNALRSYFMVAWFLSISYCTASIYMGRNYAISGELFHLVSAINNIASSLGAALVTFMQNYPSKLKVSKFERYLPWMFAAMAIFSTVTHALPKAYSGVYVAMGYYSLCVFYYSYRQWQASRGEPQNRAVLYWIIASLYSAGLYFFFMQLVPLLTQSQPLSSQIFTLGGFTLFFIGISLGVRKYKLFKLDEWWFNSWIWVFSGLSVVLVDVMLIRLFRLETTLSLAASVALMGWLYFPVRQWLIQRYFSRNFNASQALPDIIDRLVSCSDSVALESVYEDIITEVFQPLTIGKQATDKHYVGISPDGDKLFLPCFNSDDTFVLHYQSKGSRHFGVKDGQLANTLHKVATSVFNSFSAKEAAQTEERQRIRRDLHDDLGGKIAQMIHLADKPSTRQLASEAMSDLRMTLAALANKPSALSDFSNLIEAESRERLRSYQKRLNWQLEFEEDVSLPPKTVHNLSKVLREIVTNFIKHTDEDADQITMVIRQKNTNLQIMSSNLSKISPTTPQNSILCGLGLTNIKTRIDELSGNTQVSYNANTFSIDIGIPLSNGK